MANRNDRKRRISLTGPGFALADKLDSRLPAVVRGRDCEDRCGDRTDTDPGPRSGLGDGGGIVLKYFGYLFLGTN